MRARSLKSGTKKSFVSGRANRVITIGVLRDGSRTRGQEAGATGQNTPSITTAGLGLHVFFAGNPVSPGLGNLQSVVSLPGCGPAEDIFQLQNALSGPSHSVHSPLGPSAFRALGSHF